MRLRKGEALGVWSRPWLCAFYVSAALGCRSPENRPITTARARLGEDLPGYTFFPREGEPEGTVALSVNTEGIDSDVPAAVAIALGAIVEARLGTVSDARALLYSTGFRVTISGRLPPESLKTLRAALESPIADADVSSALARLDALRKRPLPHRELFAIARCKGEAFADERTKTVDRSLLERWRAAAFSRGRAAFVVAARSEFRSDALSAFGAPLVKGDDSRADLHSDPASALTYVGSDPRARISIAIPTARAEDASFVASEVSPLAEWLRMRGAELTDVTAVAHRAGGCLAATIEMTRKVDGTQLAEIAQGAVRIFSDRIDAGAAKSFHELDGALGGRDLAERWSWWRLTEPSTNTSPAIESAQIRFEWPKGHDETPVPSPKKAEVALDLREKIENGSGETWALLASTCPSPTAIDRLFWLSRNYAANRSEGLIVEPWLGFDGAGLLIHGRKREGETGGAFANRLARAAVGTILNHDSTLIERARAAAVAESRTNETRARELLLGETNSGTGEEPIRTKANALLKEPLRISVIESDSGLSKSIRDAVQVWLPSERSGCVPTGARTLPTKGIISFDSPVTEAWLSWPVKSPWGHTQALAVLLTDRFLGRALEGLATQSSASIIGSPSDLRLLIHIRSSDAALDSAVMQVRALITRLQATPFSAADGERTTHLLAQVAADPRVRLVSTWRGPIPSPTADDLQRALSELRDESLTIIASRPARKL